MQHDEDTKLIPLEHVAFCLTSPIDQNLIYLSFTIGTRNSRLSSAILFRYQCLERPPLVNASWCGLLAPFATWHDMTQKSYQAPGVPVKLVVEGKI